MQVMENLAGLSCHGKLPPDVLAKEFALRAQQLFGTTIQEGKAPLTVDSGDRVCGGFENLSELADGGVSKELGTLPVSDVAGDDDDAIFVGASRHFEPDVERLRVVGLEFGGDAPFHGGDVIGAEGFLPVRRKPVPEVFADELVGFENGESGAISKRAVPILVNADDRVHVAVEDLLQLADGLVAHAFSVLASGNVAIVEGDAVLGGKNVDVKPGAERVVKVLGLLRDASMHDVMANPFKFGTQNFGEQLPVRFAVDLSGQNAADPDGLGVGVSDYPVAVEAEQSLRNLRDKTRQIVVLSVGLAPETSAPIDRDGGGINHPFKHEFAARKVMLHLTGEL